MLDEVRLIATELVFSDGKVSEEPQRSGEGVSTRTCLRDATVSDVSRLRGASFRNYRFGVVDRTLGGGKPVFDKVGVVCQHSGLDC